MIPYRRTERKKRKRDRREHKKQNDRQTGREAGMQADRNSRLVPKLQIKRQKLLHNDMHEASGLTACQFWGSTCDWDGAVDKRAQPICTVL